jgi:hypothetical protein
MHPQNNVTEDTFHVKLQGIKDEALGPPGFPYAHWYLGDTPLWLNFSKPTILNVESSLADPNYVVVSGTLQDPNFASSPTLR